MKKIIATLFVFSLAGCASITQGTTQTIIFNLEPKETKCNVSRDGDGEIGSVSFYNNTLNVSKDKDDIIISCSAPGYQPKTSRLISSTQTAGVVGGAFIDLGVTDMMTGAMWKYPNETSIVLRK